MTVPAWLLEEAVISIQQMLIAEHGGLPGIRDRSLLESALNRPKQQIAYGDNYGLAELTASYCYGLARNHPFNDGNKRIALTVAGVFLEINGHSLVAPEAEAVLIIEGLAAGKLKEEDLAAWFSDNMREIE